MDVTGIRSRVRSLSGDSSGVVMILDSDIFAWIDEAQLEILRVTGAITTSSVGPASAYPKALPVDWLRTTRVTYNGIPLTPCSVEDLDALGVDLTAGPAVPSFFFHTNATLNLYPDPVSTDATSVAWYYSKNAAVIASVATPLDVPLTNHVDVLDFVMSRAYEKMGNERESGRYMTTFEQRLTNRGYEATNPDDTYPVIRDDPRDVYG